MPGLSSSDTGFAWLYTIVFIFILGIVHMLIFPIINAKVIPSLVAASTLTGADLATFSTQCYRVMFYMRLTTYIFLFSIFIYMLLSVFRRDETQVYV